MEKFLCPCREVLTEIETEYVNPITGKPLRMMVCRFKDGNERERRLLQAAREFHSKYIEWTGSEHKPLADALNEYEETTPPAQADSSAP